jgi:hypothetical protein
VEQISSSTSPQDPVMGQSIRYTSYHEDESDARLDTSIEELWFRNVYGYFESVFAAKQSFSFLQLMVFWDEAEAVIGDVPKPVGLFITFLFGASLSIRLLFHRV